jgi:hypothetical protein
MIANKEMNGNSASVSSASLLIILQSLLALLCDTIPEIKHIANDKDLAASFLIESKTHNDLFLADCLHDQER